MLEKMPRPASELEVPQIQRESRIRPTEAEPRQHKSTVTSAKVLQARFGIAKLAISRKSNVGTHVYTAYVWS